MKIFVLIFIRKEPKILKKTFLCEKMYVNFNKLLKIWLGGDVVQCI